MKIITREELYEKVWSVQLKDPDNPIRRVRDLLLESAKQMIRDGRMKMVDGVPVFSEEVNKMLAVRNARAHARCTQADPCGGVFNPRIKTSPAASETPSKRPQWAPGIPWPSTPTRASKRKLIASKH
jgi:hypothetical protein